MSNKFEGTEKQFERVLCQAISEAQKNDVKMVVVHAPIENAEEVDNGNDFGPFGYCPHEDASTSFPHAVKHKGQKDCPARGIVAVIDTEGFYYAPKVPLPAEDPDEPGKNAERADWAREALQIFMDTTGADQSDALCELLGNLMHLADRTGYDFKKELGRAVELYDYETSGTGAQFMESNPPGTPKLVEMKFDEWVKVFNPLPNTANPTAHFNGTLFEADGPQFDLVRNHGIWRVWTLIDEGGELCIRNGFHLVNRVGYFVTKKEFRFGFSYRISRQ